MSWVLLVGAALNLAGAARLLLGAWLARDGPSDDGGAPLQMALFVAGTAVVFGAMYLYLHAHPDDVVPFVSFGAALKTWAFVLSAGLLVARRLSLRQFAEFGVTNGLVAALFWAYLATGP